MTVGPDTLEYVAAKAQPLPFNKEPRDWIYEVPLDTGGTQTLYKGFVGQVPEVMQKPSIGRVVHYRSYGTPNGEYVPEVRAAIITAVSGDDEDIRVSLCVLNPTGMFFSENVSYSVSTPGCWSWPPRA